MPLRSTDEERVMAAWGTCTRFRFWAWTGALTLAALTAACGGGGGGSPAAAPAPGPTILDSFGQPVGGESGIGDGDSGADGTAGEGKPIAGGTVTITDAQGKSVSTTTDAQGYYRAKVTGFTAPFVVRITQGTKTLHSLNVQPPVANGFVTINITSLTEKVAFDVARSGGAANAAALTPALVAANRAAIVASILSLRAQLANVIGAAGLDANSFDPIAAPFRADHTGYDKVLDNVALAVNPDGYVAVAPVGASAPALPGVWQLLVTTVADGQAHSFDAGTVPGANILGEPAVAANVTLSAIQSFAAQYQGLSITSSGSTIRIAGASTDLTVQIQSASLSLYQGCATACGVGAVVSYTTAMRFTLSGVAEGGAMAPVTSNTATTFRYTRVS
jgi:hypothetical protein